MKNTVIALFAAAAAAFAPASASAGDWRPAGPMATDAVIGSSSAPVTVYEYASLTCPHCARFHEEAWPDFRRDYVDTGKARVVFRHLPLDQSALAGAMALACVPSDAREEAVGKLFSRVAEWAPQLDIAPVLSDVFGGDAMSVAQAVTCMAREGLPEAIMDAAYDAIENGGVDGTPAFVVDGAVHVGAISSEALGAMVDDRIAELLLSE